MITSYSSDLEELAAKLAGNHRHFDSFCWHDQPDEDADQWCIVYTHNRDSDLLAQSNASVIDEVLSAEEFADHVSAERHSHFACGWVDGYAIRVYDAKLISEENEFGITPAFSAYAALAESLSDYPVLDDEDYSRREHEATLENLKQESSRLITDDAPDSWLSDLYDAIEEDEAASREFDRSDDGHGKSLSRDTIRRLLFDLELLQPDWYYEVVIAGRVVLCTESQKRAFRSFRAAKYYHDVGIAPYSDAITVLLMDGDDISDKVPTDY